MGDFLKKSNEEKISLNQNMRKIHNVYHVNFTIFYTLDGLTLNIDWLLFQKYWSKRVNRILSNPKLASRILEGMVQEVVMIFPMPSRKNKKHNVGTCHVESGLKNKLKN